MSSEKRMPFSLLPRELAGQLATLPRDAATGRLALPAPLAEALPSPARNRGNGAEGLMAYRLLGALGISGWTLRLALVDALLLGWPELARDPQAAGDSGLFKRAFARLRSEALWEERTVRVAGRPAVLVRLAPRGRELLVKAGVACSESEWERMASAHRGDSEKQTPHTAACCIFAYHARRYGYRSELAPRLDGGSRAEPDVALLRVADGRQIYVEVQRRGGDAGKRQVKWINLAGQQGFVAICGERHADARRYAEEARAARLAGGLVTDLCSLRWSEVSGDASDLPPDFLLPSVPGACGSLKGELPQDLWTHQWAGEQQLVRYDPDLEEV
jgi:hypothetical protein